MDEHLMVISYSVVMIECYGIKKVTPIITLPQTSGCDSLVSELRSQRTRILSRVQTTIIRALTKMFSNMFTLHAQSVQIQGTNIFTNKKAQNTFQKLMFIIESKRLGKFSLRDWGVSLRNWEVSLRDWVVQFGKLGRFSLRGQIVQSKRLGGIVLGRLGCIHAYIVTTYMLIG